MSNSTIKLAVIFFLFLMAVAALGQTETASGAPPGWSPPASPPPIWELDQYDSNPDATAPVAPPPSSRLVVDDSWAMEETPCAVRPSESLRSLADGQRAGSRIAVVLLQERGQEDLNVAHAATALWNSARYDESLTALLELENRLVQFAVLTDWVDPVEAGMRIGGPDRQVIALDTVNKVVLDFQRTVGKLYCGMTTTTNTVAVRQSTDGGATWFGGSSISSTSAIRDFDMAVVGDYIYMVVVWEGNPHYVWTHRLFCDTGFHDTDYNINLATTAEEILDVAIATNEDDFRNRVYVSTIQSNGALRHLWDVSTDGTTFTEILTGVANATGMLDMHWNQDFDTRYLFISYLADGTTISILGRAETEWAPRVVDATYTGSVNRTAVSAHADAVFVAYSEELDNGDGVRYRVSYDAGETWNYGDAFIPAAGEGAHRMFDFTARGGAGTAAIAQQEVGEPDPVWFRNRAGYAPGLWNDAAEFNDNDVTTGSWVCMNWLPPHTHTSGSYSYGAVYLSGGTPYFDRIDHCGGDLNNDAVISLSDLAILLSHFGQAATYSQGDLDGDGIVGLSDLAQLLSVFGLECSN